MIIDRLNLVIGIISVVVGVLAIYESIIFSFSRGAPAQYLVIYFSVVAVVFGAERIYTALRWADKLFATITYTGQIITKF